MVPFRCSLSHDQLKTAGTASLAANFTFYLKLPTWFTKKLFF